MAESWEDYFEPGERLLWQGQPMPNNRPGVGMIFLGIFGLPFLGAGLFVFVTAVTGAFGANNGVGNIFMAIFMVIFSLPFIGAGAGMIFGPWYMQSRAHKKVRYALSDRRAYIASQFWSRKLEAVPISPDGAVTLEGGNSVYFHTEVGRDSDGDKTTERKGFEHIADAKEVYQLLRDIQRRAIDEAKGD